MDPIGRLQLRYVDDVPVVALIGDFDLSNAALLRDGFADLRERRANRVVLDLSETTYIDSSTIGVIAWEHGRGLTIAVHGATGGPLRALQLAGIPQILDRDAGE